VSELEEHYVLRVPEHVAEQLRAMIRERKMPNGGVSFYLQSATASAPDRIELTSRFAAENESGVREGVFRCGAESLSCSLLDLPHNVETFITSDNVNFYKVHATHAHGIQRALC
jgi:hypothetical protein